MEPLKKIFLGVIFYEIFLVILSLFLNQVVALDAGLFSFASSLHNPYLDLFFNLITYVGSSVFWVLLIVLFWLKNKKKISLHLLYAFILDTASILLLKFIFLRPRPSEVFNLGIDIEIGPSFPSGHTERAFSGAFVLSNYYKKYRILFYSLSILIAFSRVYIGLHFPLDTLIGAINGILFGAISLLIPTKRIEKIKL
jgi:undecaprenyl-diphosphatase